MNSAKFMVVVVEKGTRFVGVLMTGTAMAIVPVKEMAVTMLYAPVFQMDPAMATVTIRATEMIKMTFKPTIVTTVREG